MIFIKKEFISAFFLQKVDITSSEKSIMTIIYAFSLLTGLFFLSHFITSLLTFSFSFSFYIILFYFGIYLFLVSQIYMIVFNLNNLSRLDCMYTIIVSLIHLPFANFISNIINSWIFLFMNNIIRRIIPFIAYGFVSFASERFIFFNFISVIEITPNTNLKKYKIISLIIQFTSIMIVFSVFF